MIEIEEEGVPSYKMENSTGYGPTARLQFNGDERNYEVWEMKFMAYMRTKELRNAIDPDTTGIVSANCRERAFAELVQVLDDRSLNLIMRDAKDDGKAAMVRLGITTLGRVNRGFFLY